MYLYHIIIYLDITVTVDDDGAWLQDVAGLSPQLKVYST